MLTPDELRQIRRLRALLARRVDSPFAGEYRSAMRGQGMEFEESRPLVVGDDVRSIDWNVMARTGEPFVKTFREERELTLLLVMDLSGSVRLGGGGADGRTDKRLQGARVAGALAFAAIRNGDRVGVLSFTEQVERFLPPRKSRGHAWAVLRAAFEPPPARRGTDLARALQRARDVLARRAVVCVVSDFLGPDAYEAPLRQLCARHRVHAFVVHDPLEAALPAVGLVEVEDAETGARRLVDSGRTWARVSVEQRAADLARLGARVSAVSTAEDPFLRLGRHFRAEERRR